MRALRLEQIGRLAVGNVPIPEVRDAEVLLKVTHCAVCRTDAKMWRQGHRDLVLPRILGHEICALEQQTGARFVVWPGHACGNCRECLNDRENLCRAMKIFGFHKDGGMAEFVAAPRAGLIAAPEELPPQLACLAEPLACGLNALAQAGTPAEQELLIYGGGPVGLLLALAAHECGAHPTIVEHDPVKLARSEAFRSSLGIKGEVQCRGSAFDAVINAAPSLETVTEGLGRLRPGGRFCLFSGITGQEAIAPASLNEIHYRQLQVAGAYGCTRAQMQEALKILLKHRAGVRLLVEEIIPLEQVPHVLPKVWEGRALKIVVEL